MIARLPKIEHEVDVNLTLRGPLAENIQRAADAVGKEPAELFADIMERMLENYDDFAEYLWMCVYWNNEGVAARLDPAPKD
jgi:hypothetical protein